MAKADPMGSGSTSDAEFKAYQDSVMDPFGADVTNAVRLGQMSPAEAATMVTGQPNPMGSGQTTDREMQMMNEMIAPANRQRDLEQRSYQAYMDALARLRQAETAGRPASMSEAARAQNNLNMVRGTGALQNLQPPMDVGTLLRNLSQKVGE